MTRPQPGRLRCAIYTRKSSEEGLEQDFNSLHAQREACEAFVLSQRHEGWLALETDYADGGFSGGTLARPALQALLEDVRARRIDVVVVYKVDRLTRSLADFARIIEVLDAHCVSFVSVTQQFNTTTSMGRLTLNVLLSFAQFEREVTGERIRDKIAASKQKGLWMGGFVPLGYEASARSLVVNEAEADAVRTIFRLYLELGCVRRVKDEADRLGLVTKRRTGRNGAGGGRPLSRGHIYKLLSNAIYIGAIVHKGRRHDGQHPAIIDRGIWDAVQERLALRARRQRNGAAAQDPSLLAGLLHDAEDERLTPSHAVRHGKRYRYYVSQALIRDGGAARGDGWRIAAREIEALILGQLEALLRDRHKLIDVLELGDADPERLGLLLAEADRLATALGDAAPSADKRTMLRQIVRRIVLDRTEVQIEFEPGALRALLDRADAGESAGDHPPLTLRLPLSIKRRGIETRLVIEGPTGCTVARVDPALLKAIARAHAWLDDLVSGRAGSIAAIAQAAGVTDRYVSRLVRLAFLAPDLVEAIMNGRQPVELTAASLTAADLPLAWGEQRIALGFT